MSFVSQIKDSFRASSALSVIITINLFFFIFINISVNILPDYSVPDFLSNLTFPSGFNYWAHKPWTLLTYMFSHVKFWHFISNMMWVFYLGKILLGFVNGRVLTNLYLFGGVCGAILFSIIYSVIPSLNSEAQLIGASAGVMAVVVAAAVIAPESEVSLFGIFQLKLKYLALASFILTSILDLSENTGGKVAHIGGALYGLVFMLQYKKGKDWSKWMKSAEKLFGGGGHLKVVHKRTMTDEEYNFGKLSKQKKIDEILDKISKSGYDSLSKQEKEFLFKESNNYKN